MFSCISIFTVGLRALFLSFSLPLGVEVGCDLWLWHSLDVSLNFFPRRSRYANVCVKFDSHAESSDQSTGFFLENVSHSFKRFRFDVLISMINYMRGVSKKFVHWRYNFKRQKISIFADLLIWYISSTGKMFKHVAFMYYKVRTFQHDHPRHLGALP